MASRCSFGKEVMVARNGSEAGLGLCFRFLVITQVRKVLQ